MDYWDLKIKEQTFNIYYELRMERRNKNSKFYYLRIIGCVYGVIFSKSLMTESFTQV